MSDTNKPIELEPIFITDTLDVPRVEGVLGGAGNSNPASSWSVGFGHSGAGGVTGSGLGAGRGRRRGITNKQLRRQLRQQEAARAQEAEAQAQRELADKMYKQLVEKLTQAYSQRRAELDQAYASKATVLSQQLESEIRDAKKPPSAPSNERWLLYLLNKEKNEIDGILEKKKSELALMRAAASSFDGHNPFSGQIDSYRNQVTQYGPENSAATHDAHQRWEESYIAAHEVNLLSDSIQRLTEKSIALSARHAQQTIRYRESDAIQEGHRKYNETREQQIIQKFRIDEDARHDLIKASNTVLIQGTSTAGSVVVLGGSGTAIAIATETAIALENTLNAAVKELGRILLIRTGQTISMAATALFWSEGLGNGELTPEQRRRLFQGLGVSTNILGLASEIDLTDIARNTGFVELSKRVKAVPAQQGVELHIVNTGTRVTAQVPVVTAHFDPKTGTYRAQTQGLFAKQLIFDAPATAPLTNVVSTHAKSPLMMTNTQQVFNVPDGVDARINDCIVCFPLALGWSPQYFTFLNEPLGSGVVKGNGQPAAAGWWENIAHEHGVAIPTQLGDVLRERGFKSQDTFEKAFWKAIARDVILGNAFDEINQTRMRRGYAPYAPKAAWAAERREFELRYGNAANDGNAIYDLDTLRITRPNSSHGVSRAISNLSAWPASSASQTWTPLIPPGNRDIGSTELPAASHIPSLYPGETTEPVKPKIAAHPAVDPQDMIHDIPGYGNEDDLPSPGLVFAGPPVDPLEVGPYNDLSGRSRLDGLDIDHIVSRQALKKYILDTFPDKADFRFLFDVLQRAPSIAIPARVHQRYSETYGGRNTRAKQALDSSDLRAAVNSNLDAIKPGLLEDGFLETEIEVAREKLHRLNIEQGWYQ
ncbi:hypothetical protein CFBP3846_00444 [Pseudomonas syringae pv. avii]|uniref:Pyosin/cloacin translocation domain-containing protein n=1 Tax=Pseudomonas syringae pv. avii TaxID=663959 RepID=A0ABY1U0H0_PSESX|nr:MULTISPECIES: S-type pyocin domain-containing protein [Pseudomonas syringae group]KWT11713.1 hypothetical protein AL046_15345 [Pseudomonas syringae pv. avii]PHN56967.1 hypothetical protein AO286_16410 [Pseudomonas syringae]RMR17773.1 hypothetical protein ALP89_01341 [Pseudomonas syringae pv. persicae]SOS24883.1 hypothetical protein CFBP3846_00444 [Pseudomonas syringae pv. avii]